MRWVALVVVLSGCGGKPKVTVERAAPAAASVNEGTVAGAGAGTAAVESAGAGVRLHLVVADGEGAVVTAPAGCEVVEAHSFSSTPQEIRLHLNVAACPDGGCPKPLSGYMSRGRTGEVKELRDVGDDRAVLIERQPVLDTASVVTTDGSRAVVVACSAQTSHDDALDQTVIALCSAVAINSVGATDGLPSAPSHALLCKR